MIGSDHNEIRFETRGGVEQITRPYHEGLAAQKLGKQWGFIDETGHLAIKRKFDYCHDFCNGLAAVQMGGKWTFIDTKGALLLEPRFDDAKSFQGEFAEVKLADEWRRLSRKGELGEAISGGRTLAYNVPLVTAATKNAIEADDVGWYWLGYRIFFALIFAGCWIFCIASYGFLFGVGLGWLPSAIAATILSLFWPLILVLVLVAVVVIGWMLVK
jgi:hypothetical protein